MKVRLKKAQLRHISQRRSWDLLKRLRFLMGHRRPPKLDLDEA